MNLTRIHKSRIREKKIAIAESCNETKNEVCEGKCREKGGAGKIKVHSDKGDDQSNCD